MYKKIVLFFLTTIFLAGCVSVPPRDALSIYNVNGVRYVSLKSFCDLKGISWEYNTFAQKINLVKDEHKIDLMVGDSLALIDGKSVHLKYPVDIYQGAVVIPYKFKEQLDNVLFAGVSARQKSRAAFYKIKRIVLDAGHGGNDPGAIGRTGLREKDINLDIVKRLAKLLRADGVDVVMTRSSDRFISLQGRVDIANKSGADLFLSVHSNANRVRSLNGFEVYYVSPSVDDTKRALNAAKEERLDFDSSCFDHASLNLKATLWDMIYTHSRAQSIKLARSICYTIDRDLDTKILGVKAARYYVLKGVRMPAILIEIGFVSNASEERMLKNNFYRQQIAEGILDGLHNYSQDSMLAGAR